jgi:hypothetical protein
MIINYFLYSIRKIILVGYETSRDGGFYVYDVAYKPRVSTGITCKHVEIKVPADKSLSKNIIYKNL